MRLRVRVPVLSTHNTVQAPMVSTAGGTPGQNLILGKPPGAQSQKDSQDHRKFFRQNSHSQSQSGQKSVLPVAAGDPEYDENDEGDPMPMMAMFRTSRRVSFWRRVSSASTFCSDLPILPISVLTPMHLDLSHALPAHDQSS